MVRWRVSPKASLQSAQPALFLDRDGVVIRDRDYLAEPAGVELLPGAAAAMARASAKGFLLIGLSNQSGIGRGYFSEEDFASVMVRLDELLAQAGTGFDAFFYCPHAPEQQCSCRKPAKGLLTEASRHLAWSTAESFLVGDKCSDIELGLAAGLRSYLVRTGHGLEQESEVVSRWSAAAEVVVVADLPAAVEHALGAELGG